MILSDGEILEEIACGNLKICPLEDRQIQPASIDITLGNTFSIIPDSVYGIIDPSVEVKYNTYETDTFTLLPNQFILASTREHIILPDNLTAFVEGRSSWGRLGLIIQSAGWIDPGFDGNVTLQLCNLNRYAIRLTAGMRIGQLVFARMGRSAINPYHGKYQGQTGAVGSKIFKDFGPQ